jgi:ABC-2 type transport system ATP-binding protein
MCTSIGIMNRGELVTSGRIDEVMTAVFGGNRISVTVDGDIEPAVIILKQHAGVKVESVGENEIMLTHTLDNESVAKLIAGMIAQGIIVTGFSRKEGNLETLFMQLTGGESNDESDS